MMNVQLKKSPKVKKSLMRSDDSGSGNSSSLPKIITPSSPRIGDNDCFHFHIPKRKNWRNKLLYQSHDFNLNFDSLRKDKREASRVPNYQIKDSHLSNSPKGHKNKSSLCAYDTKNLSYSSDYSEDEFS